MKNNVLEASHDSPLGGHLGFMKTYRRVRERFTWKGLKSDVLEHVMGCVACQQIKVEHTHPSGLLQPLPIQKQKCVRKIQSYNFDIKYKKGKMNVVVDTLSRQPTISLMHVPNDWKS